MSNSNFESVHFEIQAVADGAYAVIASEGGKAQSNCAIIDLGDRTLLLDTSQTPEAAEDLERAAVDLTGRSVDMVIISHWHSDHWLGNQVFVDQAPILSTEITRDLIIEDAGGWLELKNDPSELERTVKVDEKLLAEEDDEQKKAALEALNWRRGVTLKMLPTLEPTVPNLTFNTEMTFHGSERTATLHTDGAGHTASDSYIHLQQGGVAFIADLGFFGVQPFMAYGDIPAWVSQLEKMQDWEIDVFVPGHGPVGGKADLEEQKQYMVLLEQLVGEVVDDGGTVEDALQVEMPAPYDAWLISGRGRFEANVEALYKKLAG